MTNKIKKLYPNAETGCCPKFDPIPWDEKEITRKNKLFLKDHVTSFLHIPLNFEKVIIRSLEKIVAAQALTPKPLMLSDEKSLWGSDLYIATTRDVPGAEMTTISGTFLTKVFEGPYKNMRKWINEMENYVTQKGKKNKKF